MAAFSDKTEDPLAGSPDALTLDHATWTSLTGPHARFAQIRGQAARYPPDMSPFVAVAPDADDGVWDDLAELVGPGGTAVVAGLPTELPQSWAVIAHGAGVQMVDTGLRAASDSEVVRLVSDDVADMLDLVERTKPGPFLHRTIEMGTYLGIRRGGTLVAMAGERLHPPGWTEISAVCTDPAYRGEGLATRLVRAVAAGIRARGETPFLQAAAINTKAISLYASIGFTPRQGLLFQQVRIPDRPKPAA
jgi:ribosomal protein S18 acetylase RimI-like enzyme